MLAKKFRLKAKEFSCVWEKGKAFSSPYFLFKILPNDLPYCRFSAVAPRRLFPRAVQRNRMRRQIYALAAPYVSSAPGKDIIVVARPLVKKKKKFSHWQEEWEKIWKNLP